MKALSVIIALLILASTAVGQDIRWGKSENPVITGEGWYPLDSWEIDTCSKWGGTLENQIGAVTSSPIALSRTTLTIQGRKSVLQQQNGTLVFYQASWYLEPIEGTMNYRVELQAPVTGVTKTIAQGVASFQTPAVGSYVDYLQEQYYTLRMFFGNDWIQVPLIQVNVTPGVLEVGGGVSMPGAPDAPTGPSAPSSPSEPAPSPPP